MDILMLVLMFAVGFCTGGLFQLRLNRVALDDIQHQFDNIKGRYVPFMDALIAIAYNIGDSAEDKARIAEKALFNVKE